MPQGRVHRTSRTARPSISPKAIEKRGVSKKEAEEPGLGDGQQAGQGRQERRLGHAAAAAQRSRRKKGWETRRRRGNA